MVWKRSINTTSQGDTAQFGAVDVNKIIDYLDNVEVADPVTIITDTTFDDDKLHTATIFNVGSLTLPDGPTTLVGTDTTDVLINKTLTSPVLTTPTINGATIGDATDIVLDTNIGTKIGTATGQKLAFYNAGPVSQRTGIADVASDTVDGTYGAEEATVIESLRTKVNALIQVLEDMGITATV